MSTPVMHNKANHLAATINRIAVVPVTNSSSATNLADPAHLGDLAASGQFIEICSDKSDVNYFMAPDDTVIVDEAATSGPTRCWALIKAGPQRIRLTSGKDGRLNSFFVAKTDTGNFNVRFYVSSGDTAEV